MVNILHQLNNEISSLNFNDFFETTSIAKKYSFIWDYLYEEIKDIKKFIQTHNRICCISLQLTLLKNVTIDLQQL